MKHATPITAVLSVIVLVIWLSVLGGIGYGVFKLATADWSQGVKPAVETVWCGKPGCLS